MSIRHPTFVCTTCGGNLRKEFEKYGSNSSTIKCIICGNVKNIMEALAEDEKHSQYEIIGRDPIGIKINGVWRI